MQQFGKYRDTLDFAPLYLTRHRVYSSALKRFLSPDPLGLEGGLNLYAYGAGNPLAYIDPLGLACESASESSFSTDLGNSLGRFADTLLNGITQWFMTSPALDSRFQSAMYGTSHALVGNPLSRLGAYDGAPPQRIETEMMRGIWTLSGVAAAAIANIKATDSQNTSAIFNTAAEVQQVVSSYARTTDSGGSTVTLYHGGTLVEGKIGFGRDFSTSTEYYYANAWAIRHGGTVHEYNVPVSFIETAARNGNVITGRDNISGSTLNGPEIRFSGNMAFELNQFKKP